MGTSLACRLRERAVHDPLRRAFVFLGAENQEVESLSYAQLDRMARLLGRRFAKDAEKGDRVLLLFSSGLAFVAAFFACMYAGLVPVPVIPPTGRRVRDTVTGLAMNCKATIAATCPAYAGQIQAFFAAQEALRPAPSLHVLDFAALSGMADGEPATDATIHEPGPDETAFIQYTSGSTSTPKGVVVTHGNLLANLDMMAAAFQNDSASTHVGWAPLHHDMGLIANVLQPFHVGALSVLMSPQTFAREPWLWLRAVSDYKARVSGGPNFAYDLCIKRSQRALAQGLDLSHWQVAFNSAEPVNAQTLDGFAQQFAQAGFQYRSFYPCYGLADATLLVSGGAVDRPPVLRHASKTGLEAGCVRDPGDARDARTLVGAGVALKGETVVAVNPASGQALADLQVGEIWVSGPNIPARYWAVPAQMCNAAFGATLARYPGLRFLRTGDLGFIDRGEVFITGRLKVSVRRVQSCRVNRRA